MKKFSKKKKIIIASAILFLIALTISGYFFFSFILPKIEKDRLNETAFKPLNEASQTIIDTFSQKNSLNYTDINSLISEELYNTLKIFTDENCKNINSGVYNNSTDKAITTETELIYTYFTGKTTAETICRLSFKGNNNNGTEINNVSLGKEEFLLYWRQVDNKWEIYNCFCATAVPIKEYHPHYELDQTVPSK